jgi:hypothetical protein
MTVARPDSTAIVTATSGNKKCNQILCAAGDMVISPGIPKGLIH